MKYSCFFLLLIYTICSCHNGIFHNMTVNDKPIRNSAYNDTVTEMIKINMGESPDGLIYIYRQGKDVIPYLIDSIGNTKLSLMHDFLDPKLSYIPDYLFVPWGCRYAYYINYIMEKDNVSDLPNIKKLLLSNLDYSEETWEKSISLLRLYKYGIISKKTGDTDSIVPVKGEDMKKIQAIYAKWWERNKDKTLEEMRDIWRLQPNIIDSAGYIWK